MQKYQLGVKGSSADARDNLKLKKRRTWKQKKEGTRLAGREKDTK